MSVSILAGMIGAASIVAAPIPSQAAATAWTWTLYEDGGPVVLAYEITDTAVLGVTLECERGAGLVRVASYGPPGDGAFAVLTAGSASATAEVQPRGDRISAAIPTTHPVFAAFAADGRMNVAVGQTSRSIEVQRTHLAKLRRFAELCGG